ncbi:hypothetical protein CLV58_12847 [Spirosoma oryzae]|uniref:Uncharacterized protein n=1 Tax=Spirosoma oryzae TaxID=1469603 RepID=A0A2T0S5F1_9BACT|nr:hypothetical protein CLV58_12847 [Spirosoma oryzae]
MRTIQKPNSRNRSDVQIDPTLEEYRDKILFPEKLKKANELLKNTKLPSRKRSN